MPMKRFLTASEVANAFGAGVSSVKRWCDLGLLQVNRTAGGHRRIVAGDVIQFAREDHRTILNPEPLGLAPSCDLRQPLALDEGTSLLATALTDGDEVDSFETILRLYMSGCSLGRICDEAITSSFKCIGDGWIDGRIAIYEERRACELCLSILNTMRTILPRVSPDAPLAAGCTPPGDPYSLPTTMVEVALIEAGWHACTIGRCVPFDAMQSAVASLRPSLFWLSASTVADGFPFVRHARQFGDYLDKREVTFVIGGRRFDSRTRSRVPHAYFGQSIRQLQEFTVTLREIQNESLSSDINAESGSAVPIPDNGNLRSSEVPQSGNAPIA
jgi:methanogenic corrinoid protein MtbC1